MLLLVFILPFQVHCQVLCLLHCHLSQLWMSLRIGLITFYQALIANGIDILHSLNPIETIRYDAATTSDTFSRNTVYMISTNTAHPYHCLHRKMTSILQNQFMIYIICHHTSGHYLHSEFFQGFLCLTRRLFSHGT